MRQAAAGRRRQLVRRRHRDVGVQQSGAHHHLRDRPTRRAADLCDRFGSDRAAGLFGGEPEQRRQLIERQALAPQLGSRRPANRRRARSGDQTLPRRLQHQESNELQVVDDLPDHGWQPIILTGATSSMLPPCGGAQAAASFGFDRSR
jgi:hypothetical protein